MTPHLCSLFAIQHQVSSSFPGEEWRGRERPGMWSWRRPSSGVRKQGEGGSFLNSLCPLLPRFLESNPIQLSPCWSTNTPIIQSPVSARLSVKAQCRWGTAAVKSWWCVVLRHGRTWGSPSLLPLSSCEVWSRSKKFFVGPLWGSKKEEREDVENDSELRQGGWNGTREGIW